jgi:hypothetical protein
MIATNCDAVTHDALCMILRAGQSIACSVHRCEVLTFHPVSVLGCAEGYWNSKVNYYSTTQEDCQDCML